MAVGIEFTRDVLSGLSTGPRIATAFQEGQRAATDIASEQMRQQTLQQSMEQNAALFPYRLQAAQLGTEQAAEQWRRDQEQYARVQQALGMPLVTPGMRMGTAPSGAGLRPTLRVAGTTETGAPASLVQTESGGRTDLINKWGYAGRLQFGPERLSEAATAGIIPAGVTAQQFASDPTMQARVESWHFNDINNFIQREGLGKYVGQTIGGAVVTPQGMLAVAHLGGKGGLKRFLETGGQYNPSDQLGTSLANYMGRHGGVGAASPRVPMFAQLGIAQPPAGIGMPQAGAMPTMMGVTPSGVPLAYEPQPAAPAEQTGSIFTGLPLSERPIWRALSSVFGGQSASTAVAPVPAPVVGAAPSTPLEAPFPTPQASAPTTGSIFQAPGVQSAPVQAVSPFEVMEPMRIAQAQDIARRKAEYLKSAYERARLMGNVEAMDKIQLETATFGTEVEALDRMNALTQFNAGNVAPIAAVLSKMTKGRMAIEPRSDGRFNIYDGKRKTADGLTKEELATQFRLGFDQDFKARVEAQRQAEIKYNEEVAKTRLKIYEEANKQAAQQVRELSVEQVKAQLKRPDIRVTKGDEGFVLADNLGNVSWMTVQPEVGIDGKPVYNNPADPKSGFKTRLVISPGRAPGGVPMQ